MRKKIKHLFARISLLLLALGFCLLGILSLFSRAERAPAQASHLENGCCYAGGSLSILVGAIFLSAACVYRKE
jgi:hypothetical protein